MQVNKLKNVHKNPLRTPKITLLTCFFFAFVIRSKSIATPEYLNQFKSAYNRQEATCKTCHTDPPKRNDYGKAVQKAQELPEAIQDELAAQFIEDIENEIKWQETLSKPQDSLILKELAQKAIADSENGQTEDMGFDDLY